MELRSPGHLNMIFLNALSRVYLASVRLNMAVKRAPDFEMVEAPYVRRSP